MWVSVFFAGLISFRLRDMKDVVIKVLFVLLLSVFLLKILSLFISFPSFYGRLINAAMFLLIGFTYIFVGIDKKKSFLRGLNILSGLILIVWTLASSFRVKFSIVVLLALLIPLVINSRFFESEGDNAFSKPDKGN